jgi:hypothetical protein
MCPSWCLSNGQNVLSIRHEENLLEQHLQIIFKPAAALFLLEDLKDVLWSGASLLDERKPLPARYAIVTLNMSESVNGVFTNAQNVGWLRAVVMSTRISKLHTKV